MDIDGDLLYDALCALECDFDEENSDLEDLSSEEDAVPISGRYDSDSDDWESNDSDSDVSNEPSTRRARIDEDSDHDRPSTSRGHRGRGGARRTRRAGGRTRVATGRGRGVHRATSAPPRLNINWSQGPIQRTFLPCSATVQVKNRALSSDRNVTPYKCFMDLFQESTFDFVTDMTNKNYTRKEELRSAARQARGPLRKSHELKWRDITSSEMKAFIGLMIHMGIVKMPRLKWYWRDRKSIFHSPTFGATMSRDRFLQIYRHLHFSEPVDAAQVQEPVDKLQKIRKFLELMRARFQSQYSVGQYLSLDESMVPFKGRVGFKQFIPSKRTRFGIKVWVLAESLTSYVTNFEIYLGKDTRQEPEDRSLKLGGMIVMRLMSEYLHEGRHLYMDNFYTSVPLLQKLYENGTYACGTVRRNRIGFPKEITINMRRHERGYSDWRGSGNILCYSWNDNKPVYIMSTIHQPLPQENMKKVTRRGQLEVPCPPPIVDYNKYMGGVDANDQFRKYYNITRKSNIWDRKIFGYILEVTVHNARVMYEKIIGKRCCPIWFRESLIKDLVGDHHRAATAIPLSPPVPVGELRFDMTKLHVPESTTGQRPFDCKFCRRRHSEAVAAGVDKNDPTISVMRSSYKCRSCDVPLCISHKRGCFSKWHRFHNFWPDEE